jgi:hypothetical protein
MKVTRVTREQTSYSALGNAVTVTNRKPLDLSNHGYNFQIFYHELAIFCFHLCYLQLYYLCQGDRVQVSGRLLRGS